MAKSPVAGRVKTRLCPPLDHDQAAALATAALEDTLDAVEASAAAARVLALEGAPGTWLRPSFSVIPQRHGDFGSRLAGAMEDAWARRELPMLVIGMDTPQISGPLLDEVAAALCQTFDAGPDAVIGGAEDGGYWVIGARRPNPGLFDGVPMSTKTTGQSQRHRMRALGVSWNEVAALRDIDDFDDACSVAALAPRTRFAATLRPMLGATRSLANEGSL